MLVLNAGRGLPGYAEVWTRGGWVRLDAFAGGDVLACDPETGATMWEPAVVSSAPASTLGVVRTPASVAPSRRFAGVPDAQWPVRTTVVALHTTDRLAGRAGSLVRTFDAPADAGVDLDDDAVRLIVAVARAAADAVLTPDGAVLGAPEPAARLRIEQLAYAADAPVRREGGGLRVLYDGGLGVDRLYGLSQEQARIAFDEASCGGMRADGGGVTYETSMDEAAGFVEWLAAAHGWFTATEDASGVTRVLGYAEDRLADYISDTEVPADGQAWWLTSPAGFHVVRMGGVFVAGGAR